MMEHASEWLAAIAMIVSLGAPAVGQVIYEDFKFLPSNGVADDGFGYTVAISDTKAVVGNYLDKAGSAYLFDTTTGQQITQLLPNDGVAGDSFGISVAISGTTAVVGTYGSGPVYLFDTTYGQQIAELIPSDDAKGNGFGYSVAISGTTVVVGAPLDDDNGQWSGAAYVFDTNTGQQIAKLLPSDGAAEDFFGVSVAISGDTAIVGMYRYDTSMGQYGSAYLFDTNTGQQIAQLIARDGVAGDSFGISVAMSGTTAVVGAFGDNDNGFHSGSAYLFDTTTGQQITKLLPSDGAAGDYFGYSVAINGSTAVIGAFGDSLNFGSAYLFDTITGQQIAKLLPSDGAMGDEFGFSVAINGSTAVIGSRLDDDNGNASGSAYLFDFICPADFTDDGTLDIFDVFAFLDLYNAMDPSADFTADGSFDIFDVFAFLDEYNAGCPLDPVASDP
jgi:hypothetical protein